MTRKKKQIAQANQQSPPPAISQSMQNGKTGFLDLSAELRNEIYHLALVSPHDTRIERHFTDDGRGRFHTVSPSGAIGSQEQTSGKGVNILATCRQIKEEATPILYGANKFVVEWRYRLDQFTVNTLPIVRNLRMTSIGWTRRRNIDAFCVKLRQCILQQHLQLIKLELEYRGGSQTITYFAERLTPTMRAMMKRGKSVEEAIAMFDFVPRSGSNDSYKSPSYQSLMEERAAGYTSQVKEVLGKILRK